jgi:hypothetical protein
MLRLGAKPRVVTGWRGCCLQCCYSRSSCFNRTLTGVADVAGVACAAAVARLRFRV